MTTTSILAKIGAMAAAVSTPAVLLLGGGTAQAMTAWANPGPGGVDVYVTTWPPNAVESAPNGWCLFNSSVVGNPVGKPLPAINIPFYLPENPPGETATSRLWFPSYPTGSTWNISVECPNGSQNSQLVW